MTQQYLAACVALDAAGTPVSPSFHRLVEKSYLKVDAELLNRSSEGELRKAYNILARVRNRSRVLSPISVLPPEILISILSLDTADECLTTCFAPTSSSSRPKCPAWASVCTLWRELYLRWHATSSHLDLVVGGGINNGYYRRAEIIACRSPDTSLHLVIRDRVDRAINIAVFSEDISTLIRFISPLMPRVCALDIAFKNKSQLLLDSIVTCWLNSRSRNPLKIFKVWNSIKAAPLQLQPPADVSPEGQGSPAYFWDLFRAIQTLALQHCHTPSDSCIFEGLIDLHLDWPYEDPAPFDILKILAASPCLRSLTIDDVECVQQEGSPEAVWLNSLRNLSLSQYMITNSLNRFLPWLNTTSSSINVVLRIINDPDFIPASRDFFRRSRVKRMFTYGVDRYRCTLVAQLCPAPELEELSLRDCSFIIDPLDSFSSSMADERDYVRTPWPLLHTLHLIRCTVDRENIQQLIALHPMRKLRLYCCYLYDEGDDRRKMTTGECAEFEELLSEAGIDAKCVQDQIDCPTRVNFFDGMYA